MKKLIALSLALILVLSCLAGCGAKKDDNVIRVAASLTPHSEILEAAKPLVEARGYTLEVTVFNDFIVPNQVTEDGEVDANYFQHLPYLENFNHDNGTHLASAVAVHYEPFGIYAGTRAAIADLADGDRIAIPNDGTNRARALLLLETQGIITLKEGVGVQATVVDIVENPLNLEIFEMEAAQITNVLDDVALAVINGNYALQAGLNAAEDALATEDVESLSAQTYANILCVHEDNLESEKTKVLVEVLTSEEIRDYINSTYPGCVVPVF